MRPTAIDVDEELMNRCLVLAVDEGREQTRAIHARQRAKRTLDGLRAREVKQDLLALHCNAQRLLQPLAVVNPHADRLTFLDDRTRTRRDHEKYLTLIDTIALLHQHQRPVKTLTTGDRSIAYIEVSAADIAQATALAHEVLGRSLDELPPQTRRLLADLMKLVAEQSRAKQISRRDIRFTRRELRECLGWGDTQLKVHLGRLVDLELVLAHRNQAGGRGGSVDYELVYDGDGSAVPHLSGLIDPHLLDYDAARSGQNDSRSAAGRDGIGGLSAPGRADKTSAKQHLAMVPEEPGPSAPELRAQKANGHAVSYGGLPLAAST
jgi:hypothetical protein